MATFSLRQLLCLIAILGLACASIARPFLHLEELLGVAVLMLVAFRTMEAILEVGPRRCAAAGAAIFAWTYTFVVGVGKIGDPDGSAETLRRWLHSGKSVTIEEELFWLGVLVFLLVGSWLGRSVGNRMQRESAEATDAEQSG